jgi:hypothetical protein
MRGPLTNQSDPPSKNLLAEAKVFAKAVTRLYVACSTRIVRVTIQTPMTALKSTIASRSMIQTTIYLVRFLSKDGGQAYERATTPETLTTFISQHFVPLMPEHPLYPGIGTTYPICYDAYHPSHAPILVANVTGCRNHIFGYQCLRKAINSGVTNAKCCPLCRTTWFQVRRIELRRVNRDWEAVEQNEEEVSNENAGGKKAKVLDVGGAVRNLVALGRRLVGW